MNMWETTGNFTCPMCRRPQGEPRYKVTVQIENLYTTEVDRHIATVLNDDVIRELLENLGDTEDFRFTTLTFDNRTLNEIQEVLNEFEIRLN